MTALFGILIFGFLAMNGFQAEPDTLESIPCPNLGIFMVEKSPLNIECETLEEGVKVRALVGNVGEGHSESFYVSFSLLGIDKVYKTRVEGLLGGALIASWTAPGDQGDEGQADLYDLRYFERPITEANWDSTHSIPNPPLPSPAGTPEAVLINDLTPGVFYYFGIKTKGSTGLWSELSNIALGSPGSTFTEWVKIDSLPAGEHVLVTCADADDEIQEENKDNNCTLR